MAEKKEINIEIGKRIKIARENIGYTQEKFAEKIERSVQYVSDLERGKVGPSIQTLINICKVLSVTTDYLLLGKKEPATENDFLSGAIANLPPEQLDIVRDAIRLILRAFTARNDPAQRTAAPPDTQTPAGSAGRSCP